jgi:DNA-binding NarL/FixJ family response regulator
MEQIRILLADDHTVLRDGLRLILERQPGFVVAADAGDGREAVALALEHSPDIVLMDIAMPGMNGIEATRRIVEKLPRAGVVILSMHADESYVLRSLKAGARGYLLKDSVKADLILQLVAEGKTNKEVANFLDLSLYTVETHRTHILQKLNLHSVPELILYAVRKGIIS